MPICFDGNSPGHELLTQTYGSRAKSPGQFRDRFGKSITIGLINNMPDAAVEATERQFLSLLGLASGGIFVRLSLFTLPDVARNGSARRHLGRFYSDISELWNGHVDGLIVTGREPQSPNLMDEPYWNSLTKTLEWANQNTHSTVCSCLAAHAAVLHADGIGRHKNDDKHSGVFQCERQSDHPLVEGAPRRFRMPHSRWNGLAENELTECGYRVLARAKNAGVDTFVKQRKSLFVFFQGHPEYESDSLLLEYRRDIRRFLKGETKNYPSMPQSYFTEETAAALVALEEKAMARPGDDVLAELESTLMQERISNTWHTTAVRLYRNWLEHIWARKELGSPRVSSSRSRAVGCRAPQGLVREAGEAVS